MADVSLVNEVNGRIRGMIDEMTRNRENPRMIQLAQELEKLTDTGANGPAHVEAQAAPIQAELPAEHRHVWNVFGRCKCGACQHLKVVGGVCIVCDQKIPQAA